MTKNGNNDSLKPTWSHTETCITVLIIGDSDLNSYLGEAWSGISGDYSQANAYIDSIVLFRRYVMKIRYAEVNDIVFKNLTGILSGTRNNKM